MQKDRCSRSFCILCCTVTLLLCNKDSQCFRFPYIKAGYNLFDVAERGKCDEFFVIHALAFALFAGLQSKYVVKSSVMCGLLPEDFELPRDRVRPVCINRAAVMSNPLVVNSKRRKHNEQAYLLLLQS